MSYLVLSLTITLCLLSVTLLHRDKYHTIIVQVNSTDFFLIEDGIMTMIYALMWTVASIICIVDAARHDSGVLGAAAVSFKMRLLILYHY